MAAPVSAYKDRHFLAVIGDEVGSPKANQQLIIKTDQLDAPQDSVTGLLLAGIGV